MLAVVLLNTTPVLVLRFEGQTDAALQRIEHDMLALLRQVKPDADDRAEVFMPMRRSSSRSTMAYSVS